MSVKEKETITGNETCERHEEHKKSAAQALNNMPTDSQTIDMALFFSMFSDSSRLMILRLLESGPLCVGHICEALGMSQSAVSHQLATMKHMNIIKSKKDGRQSIYSLADDHVKLVIDIAFEHISEKK